MKIIHFKVNAGLLVLICNSNSDAPDFCSFLKNRICYDFVLTSLDSFESLTF